MKPCSIPSCNNQATRKGLCSKHYMRQYRKNRPTYTQGLDKGRTQILDALNTALEPHQGSAYVRGNSLYIELQGVSLQAPLSYTI